MDIAVPAPALQELQAWVEKARADRGLVEVTFCPGSDREVGLEEAAAVALAMIKHAKI